ncbi:MULTISPECIES: AprI/Inh family metalloprotease inhibitor [Afifella]|uniref:AprI/Inh family metalloprotease inhibitor n=1 Tax=Afifella TaxID=643217 RepID=UPI00196B7FEB|nr:MULTISPECIES: AprI/Inh family metalloprotease inhibitor [Afifella]MCT8268663.1 protease inhibitor Inh/omp19 family protein [Afifella sp. JA880]
MSHSWRAIAATAALAASLAACQSAYFGGQSSNRYSPPPPPRPLTAAPVGTVSQAELPPPSGASASNDPMMGEPPDLRPGSDGNVQTATATPPTSGGAAIGRTDLLGGWTVSSGGDSCQLFMSLTSWSGGYRASTRGCTSPALQNVSAWNLSGNQVTLLDQGSSTVARLYSTSKTQFNGQTEAGAAISVAR